MLNLNVEFLPSLNQIQWRTQGGGTRARAPPLAISGARGRRKNK